MSDVTDASSFEFLNSPEGLQLSAQSGCELVVDLDHDRVLVVFDVSEEVHERNASGACGDDFNLRIRELISVRVGIVSQYLRELVVR